MQMGGYSVRTQLNGATVGSTRAPGTPTHTVDEELDYWRLQLPTVAFAATSSYKRF